MTAKGKDLVREVAAALRVLIPKFVFLSGRGEYSLTSDVYERLKGKLTILLQTAQELNTLISVSEKGHKSDETWWRATIQSWEKELQAVFPRYNVSYDEAWNALIIKPAFSLFRGPIMKVGQNNFSSENRQEKKVRYYVRKDMEKKEPDRLLEQFVTKKGFKIIRGPWTILDSMVDEARK